MADEQRDEHNDEGITAKLKDGIRLPKSVAEQMAPASKWFVYALSATCFIYGVCLGIARIIEASK